ncbi:glycosyltransferase [Pseudoalteromonas sp. EB27]|uniref:glycosyltransferase family 4 protein n=1 Tax=Pseudoalteromonas sp. EB27 TaxID=1938368 RepID=UPI0009759528|nr:glycosyltransferase [Pseudoalteromonas sp. EB27]
MHVVLTSASSYPAIGGVQNSMVFIARELIRRGNTVTVISFDGKKSYTDTFNHEGCTYYKFPEIRGVLAPILAKKFTLAVKELFKNEVIKPDLVISRHALVSYGLIKMGLKVPLVHIYPTTSSLNAEGVLSQMGNLPLIKKIKTATLLSLSYLTTRFVEKKVVQNSINVVFSNFMLSTMGKDYRKNKFFYIKPGVDTDKFECIDKNTICKLNVSEGVQKGYELLYVGRLALNKNVGILIESMITLPEHYKLVIVGDGPLKSFLMEYSKKLGIDKRVLFVGSQDKLLPVFYNLAKVTVLPTKIETFGQVIVESLACGTPVVAFDSLNASIKTASNEIITAPFLGELCAKYSAEALGKSIIECVERLELDGKSARRGYIIDNYSWDSFVDSLLKIARE